MASARSSSLRSQPGYSTRATTTTTSVAAPPAFAPTMPTMPTIDDARAPNAATRSWLSQQLGQLPDLHNANLTNVRAGAKQALTGYGGWKFRDDDPNTAAREDLTLDFDGNAGPGEREKGAIKGEVAQGNARGMLESSFTNQNIGQAIQRLSLEAQAIATQYASSIQGVQNDYAAQVSNITGQWVSLYGQDAAWLVENPPPTPAPPPVVPVPEDPSTWGPAELAGAPPKNAMGYKDFLKGRKSTSALAREWDRDYNYGRRFGAS